MKRRRRGAPEKVPGGLTKVLFVRCARDLVVRLDRATERESRRVGYRLSRADVIRKLLEEALAVYTP
jgi:hypothetical protein